WIASMVASLQQAGISLGYSPLRKETGMVNSFALYDNWYTALQYFSYAARNIPYMGVGRNLVFRKKVFLDTNPFSTNYHIAGGDDDIFVSMASSKGIKINTSVKPESWVHTDSKKTWK